VSPEHPDLSGLVRLLAEIAVDEHLAELREKSERDAPPDRDVGTSNDVPTENEKKHDSVR